MPMWMSARCRIFMAFSLTCVNHCKDNTGSERPQPTCYTENVLVAEVCMNIEAYHAAYEHAVYLDRSTAGCVELKGRDRLALIHRLSTNAVSGLAPGQGALTVFTNHNARIMDLALVLALDDDTAWVITSPGRGP